MSAPLYEQIVSWITTEIREKRLRPGDRVMSERELAQHFGVSTMTSKGALSRLAAQGLIVRLRGKGSFVADVTSRGALVHKEEEEEVAATAASERFDTDCLSANEGVTDRLIALIMPGFADSFGAKVVRAAEDACATAGLHLLIRLTRGLREVEDQAIDDCLRIGVSGILVMPVHGEHYNTKILRLVLDGFPIVLLDRFLKGIPAQAVCTDNVLAGRDLTDFLFTKGHRRIAFLSPPLDTSSISDRLQGYQQAHTGRGYLASPKYVYTGVRSTMPIHETEQRDEMIDREQRSLELFLQGIPEVTAYVACEYEIALLAQRVLAKNGMHVPKDVSIVCFDTYHGVMDEVFFTHVRQDEEAMGRLGVNLAVQAMLGNATPFNVKIPHQIIESHSTREQISVSV